MSYRSFWSLLRALHAWMQRTRQLKSSEFEEGNDRCYERSYRLLQPANVSTGLNQKRTGNTIVKHEPAPGLLCNFHPAMVMCNDLLNE